MHSFTISHFGSANITTQTAICQVGSPRRSPRFLNKSENRQNSLKFILRYYSAFCLNKPFKFIRIHSETQVLVAPPLKQDKSLKFSDFFFYLSSRLSEICPKIFYPLNTFYTFLYNRPYWFSCISPQKSPLFGQSSLSHVRK